MWTAEDADREARQFVEFVLDGRPTVEDADPVEFARVNSLTILFGSNEQAAFETYLARMPAETATRWRDLLAGGATSEAFGPLTLEEKLDEHQVETALKDGRRQRIINLVVALVVVSGLGIGGYLGWQSLADNDLRTSGTLKFTAAEVSTTDGSIVGGSPVADPRLTVSLARDVAIAAGDGPREDRIVTAPFADYLYPPSAISASVFSYGGVGVIAFVGPAGFTADACLVASVSTGDLRPLDTVWYGNCKDPIGRSATIRCLGNNAVALDVRVPDGEVPLPEGGTGFADAIRLQSISDGGSRYEILSVRGTIAVGTGSDVVVPAFGGAAGDGLLFDFGEGRSGSCALTDEVLRP